MTAGVVVHLGLAEAAPVRLQQALERLRGQLHQGGVGVVTPAGSASAASPARSPARSASGDAANAPSLATRAQREAARVARSDHHPAPMVVCAEGLLEGHHVTGAGPACARDLDLAAIPEVLAACGATSARVVLYIRRQDRLLELAHLRAVRLGRAHEAVPLARGDEALMSYEALVGWLRRLPYVDDVVVRPFELVAGSAAHHARDLLLAGGVTAELDWGAVGTDLAPDPVYSAQACRIAVDTAPFLESERERRLLDEFLLARFAATDEPSTRLLSEGERARILEAHAEANRALFAQHIPDVPADAYTSEEATLSLAATGRSDRGAAGTPEAADPADPTSAGSGGLRRWAMTAAPIARLRRSGGPDGERRRLWVGRRRRRPATNETRRSLSP